MTYMILIYASNFSYNVIDYNVLFSRGKEHLTAIENGEAGHPMVRHGWEEH